MLKSSLSKDVSDTTMTSTNEKKPIRKPDGPLAPDGGWGWVVCFASFACNLLVTGINTSPGILLVSMLDTFHESVTKTSLVMAVMNGLTMMIGPLVSGFLSFCSHRQIIIAGSLLGALSMFASVYAPSIDVMIFTFGFIGGVSLGMIFFAANVIVGLYFTKKRGLAVGIANAGAGLGTFLLNFGIEKLIRYYALRGMLLMLSGFTLNLVVFGALCRPLIYRKISSKEEQAFVSQQNEVTVTVNADQNDDEKEDMLKKYQTESVSKKDISADNSGRCMTLWKYICTILDFSLLKNYHAIMLLIIFFLWAANQVVMVYLPLYCISIGLNSADAAVMMSIVGIGCTIGELLIGVLLDFFHFKSDQLMTVSMILMGSTTLAIPLLNDIYSIGAIVMVWSMAVGFGVSLRILLLIDLLGVENLAPLYSFVMFSNGIGYGIYPPVFGWLYDKTKSFHFVFNMTAAVFFINLIFTFIINYQLKNRASENTDHEINEDKMNASDV